MEFIRIGQRCINLEAVAYVRWIEATVTLEVVFAVLDHVLVLTGPDAQEAWAQFQLASAMAAYADSASFEEMQEAVKKGGA